MNTVYLNDENLLTSSEYQQFIKDNPSTGYLKIRASAASQAIPINNLKVTVYKIIGNNRVIFFEGYTNDSGIIEKISLPAPPLNPNDEIVPKSTTYDIETTYLKDNLKQIHKVNIYENICVVQTINIIPNNYKVDEYYGY